MNFLRRFFKSDELSKSKACFLKKYRLYKRLLKNSLSYIEKKYPKISKFLRYHSVLEDLSNNIDCRIETKNIDWIRGPYLKYFQILNQTNMRSEIIDENITSYTLKTEDYIVHGNIKHPVRKTTGKVLRFYPSGDLTLTDAYPLPFYRKKFVEGTIIFIPNNENYYHLMIDYLLPSFLEIISNKDEHSYVTFLVQKRFSLIDIFQDLLIREKIQSTQIKVNSSDQFTGGKLLLRGSMATHPQIQSVFPSELNKLISCLQLNDNKKQYDRIYISRKNANRRRLLNESDLIHVLDKYQISVVELNSDDPWAQLTLFYNASLIISVHGASLTNIIWSRKTKVIEIFPRNLTPIQYLNFSAQLGHGYSCFFGTTGNSKENFELDIDKFEKYLVHELNV